MSPIPPGQGHLAEVLTLVDEGGQPPLPLPAGHAVGDACAVPQAANISKKRFQFGLHRGDLIPFP